MNVIETNPGLNGFLGDLIGGILQPGSASQNEQLTSELYYKDQELAKVRSNLNTTLIVAGVLGVATAYLGYKQYAK